MSRNGVLMASLLAFLSATGCSTIYFHNGAAMEPIEYSEWHHGGILGLVEFSDAVDLSQRCEGKPWATVRTQETFVQGLVSRLTYDLYTPRDVAYACSEKR